MTHKSLDEDRDFQALHKNVNAICCFLNESLADSRARTTQYAATRSIKRLIKDFARLNKDKVPITNVLKLFRRLDREVATLLGQMDWNFRR